MLLRFRCRRLFYNTFHKSGNEHCLESFHSLQAFTELDNSAGGQEGSTKPGKTVIHIQAGSSFGEQAILHSAPHRHTARAGTLTEVFIVHKVITILMA